MSANILIVDDSPTVRNIIKIYLMPLRIGILEADDAQRALQVLRLVPVSVVIADTNMPGMDGITFAGEVRASPLAHVRDVPFILLTADRSAELRARATEAGVNAFIQKPVSHSELTATVRQLLPQRAP